jgi:hypothetical protein
MIFGDPKLAHPTIRSPFFFEKGEIALEQLIRGGPEQPRHEDSRFSGWRQIFELQPQPARRRPAAALIPQTRSTPPLPKMSVESLLPTNFGRVCKVLRANAGLW